MMWEIKQSNLIYIVFYYLQELESLTYKRDKDKNELIERADDYEQMAMKRLEKVSELEGYCRV